MGYNFNYLCYWRNDFNEVLVVDPESSFGEIISSADGDYKWRGGGFFSKLEVENRDLTRRLNGSQELKDFEKKYQGKFKVRKIVDLFPDADDRSR